MKKNLIRSLVQTGKYKDSQIELNIGEDSETTELTVNGKPLDNVFGIHIHMRAGQRTTLIIEKYAEDTNEESS